MCIIYPIYYACGHDKPAIVHDCLNPATCSSTLLGIRTDLEEDCADCRREIERRSGSMSHSDVEERSFHWYLGDDEDSQGREINGYKSAV